MNSRLFNSDSSPGMLLCSTASSVTSKTLVGFLFMSDFLLIGQVIFAGVGAARCDALLRVSLFGEVNRPSEGVNATKRQD